MAGRARPVRDTIHGVGPGRWLVDLDQDRTGYHRFVSAWVHDDGVLRYVVDPGPSASIPHLVAALAEIGVPRLDLVLLTHIHIDHAGGTGHLLRTYPEARVGVSERATDHLLDPTRLWEGTRKVLGDLAEVYGPILPIPRTALLPPAALENAGIRMVPTPGHAPHHVAFLHGEVVFGGEVAGTRAPVGSSVYRRPATPPRFKPDVALASIDRLLARSDLPPTFAFGHWGLDPHAPAALARGRDQIERWVRLVDDAKRGAPPDEPLDPLVDRLLPRLLDHDPDFAPYRALPPDVRSRERTFIANSIAGMRGYLREEAGEEG